MFGVAFHLDLHHGAYVQETDFKDSHISIQVSFMPTIVVKHMLPTTQVAYMYAHQDHMQTWGPISQDDGTTCNDRGQ